MQVHVIQQPNRITIGRAEMSDRLTNYCSLSAAVGFHEIQEAGSSPMNGRLRPIKRELERTSSATFSFCPARPQHHSVAVCRVPRREHGVMDYQEQEDHGVKLESRRQSSAVEQGAPRPPMEGADKLRDHKRHSKDLASFSPLPSRQKPVGLGFEGGDFAGGDVGAAEPACLASPLNPNLSNAWQLF